VVVKNKFKYFTKNVENRGVRTGHVTTTTTTTTSTAVCSHDDRNVALATVIKNMS
jgi:hypothetical protein